MTQRMEIPITTLADGTAMAVITPMSCTSGMWYENTTYLPFIQVAANSTDKPFATAGSYNVPGPFSSQASNIICFNVDACMVDFIQT